MAYEKVIKQMNESIGTCRRDVAVAEAQASNARGRLRKFEGELRKVLQKQERDENMAKLDIPHRVPLLAAQVVERAEQVKRMREANRFVRNAFWKLAAFSRSAALPKYGVSGSRDEKAFRILTWMQSVLAEDTASKSASLKRAVDAEFDRHRTALYKEQFQNG